MAYIGQAFSPATISSNILQDSSILESKIANLAVTVNKIAANAVTSAKIEEGTIITGDLADSAITSAKLASGLTLGGITTLTSAALSNSVSTVRISEGIVELGNTHTNPNINLFAGTVFRATLNANATFTVTGANVQAATGVSSNVSSFTLILTNDNVANRTVAFAGGTFRFPGGAASLARTTGAGNTDVWFFFTPDQGTTYFGSQPMKDLLA